MMMLRRCVFGDRAKSTACAWAAVALLLSFMTHAAEGASGFDQQLSLEGITFHVLCPNDSSLNQLEIIHSGLEVDNAPIKREVDGTVTGAEVADLNSDGSPEIYVYVTSAGSGSYGTLVAYSANKKKSLSEIYLPPLEDDPDNAKGYMGHDRVAVVETSLVRRFPIYKEGDSNAEPTGGMRQLQYKLVAGEAGWVLKLVNSTSF
jgi:Periplasmic lysozyme inhibitor of I-type lysozyme